MKATLIETIQWSYLTIAVFQIIFAATRRNFRGKPWLIIYLGVNIVVMLAYRLLNLLKFYGIDSNTYYHFYELPLNIIGITGFCMMIPFLFAITSPIQNNIITGTEVAGAGSEPSRHTIGDTTNPLYGVHGWLKIFVVVNMYIAPIIFGVQQIMGFIGFAMLAEDYPGIVVVGVIEAGVGTFLMIKWILIARRLRDIQPRIVQEAKRWLLITLAWNMLITPLVFASGMDAEDLMPGVVKGLFQGIVSFAIWYSYFNVSKRVKATYPDWDQ